MCPPPLFVLLGRQKFLALFVVVRYLILMAYHDLDGIIVDATLLENLIQLHVDVLFEDFSVGSVEFGQDLEFGGRFGTRRRWERTAGFERRATQTLSE